MGEPMRSGRGLGLCAALALALLAGSARADDAAEDKPRECLVRVVHAKAEGSDFDPQLEPLRGQLTRPPLSAWKSFRLLQPHKLTLAKGRAEPFALPGHHTGELTYEGTVTGSKERLRFKLVLKDGAAKLLSTNYVLNDGGTIMQAGMKHERGMLILGITCKTP